MAKFSQVGVEAVVNGFSTFLVQMGAMNKAIAATGVAGATSAIGIGAFATAVGVAAVATGLALAGGLAAVATGFLAVGVAGINTARSVDDAFTSVAKTTNGLTDNFGNISEAGFRVRDEFRGLAKEIPLTLEELLEIGALAGQLGIPEEALAGFTRTIAALGVSTNLSVEQASLSLARILNIYDVTAGDMSEVTERLASSIVFLGNNFATTEQEVTDFAERIAGAAKIAGILPADIAGIGAAFTSVGVEAQAGGTAVQTVIIEMTKAVATGSDELDIFAKTAGLTVDEFTTLFEDDAAGAFGQFVSGLGDAGIDAFEILEDLGVADRRIIRGFLSVAGAGDLLTETIEASNEAFEANTALTREADLRYSTFNSKLAIVKNTLRDVALEIGDGLLPMFEGILENLGPLIDELSGPFVGAFNEVRDAVFDELLPALGDLFLAFGVDITTESLVTSIQNFGTSVADGIKAIAGVTETVTELVDAFKEGGIDGLLEELGIEDDTAQIITDVGESILVFSGSLLILIGAAKGLGLAGLALGTLAFNIGEVGAAIGLFWQGITTAGGLAATIGVGATVGVWIVALALLATAIFVFGEDAKKNLEGIVKNIGIILQELGRKLQTWLRETEEKLKTNDIFANWEGIFVNMGVFLGEWAAQKSTEFGEWIEGLIAWFSTTTPQEAAEAWIKSIGDGFSDGIAYVLGILQGFLADALAIINAIPNIGQGSGAPPYVPGAPQPPGPGPLAPDGSRRDGGTKNKTYNTTVNATYNDTQSASSVSNDLSLLAKLRV